jgi:RNA polymerase sigma-70 factor (ECF subfamily)
MSDSVDIDAKLVERVQKGDKRAFDLLVIKYQHKIYALVSRLVNDHAEVQDVAQESFIKAYRALPNFRGESAFYTWLYRIAVNTAKNYLVSRNRRPPGTDVDVDDAAQFAGDSGLRDIDSPEQQLQGEQMIKIVDKAIAALPEDLRTALSLREFDGLSYEEIAEVMQCPVGTVRSRIFRAREAIDKELEPLMHRTRS